MTLDVKCITCLFSIVQSSINLTQNLVNSSYAAWHTFNEFDTKCFAVTQTKCFHSYSDALLEKNTLNVWMCLSVTDSYSKKIPHRGKSDVSASIQSRD